MQRRGSFFFIFLIFVLITIVIIIFSQQGSLQGATGFFESITSPIKHFTFQSLHPTESIDKVRQENISLRMQLAKQKEMEKENQALHDQFHTTTPPSTKLLPANIIGMVGFVPGSSEVDEIIIDKGQADGVKNGSIIVSKNNLVGRVAKASAHISDVYLISHKGVSFTVTTSKTSALGVIKGAGSGSIILDNVVLSDKLEKGDMVVTKGDINANGQGFPPGLVVGKVGAIYKMTSALFQTAEVESLIDFSRLSKVFVIIGQF